MHSGSFLYAVLALLFVLSLIWLVSYSLRRFVYDKNFHITGQKPKRISIEEVKFLDAKRKLAIIKKDDKEYFILLGVNSDLLISQEKIINLKESDITVE